MSGAMVSVATGVMNSAVEKLTTLLGNEFKLSSDLRSGIRFMRDELSSMSAALLTLADMDDDQIDAGTKDWRRKVRELSYDIEDCVDRFMLLHSSGKAKVNFLRSMVRKIKELWEDRQIGKEIQELKALVVQEKERRDRYNIDQYLGMAQPVHLDPRVPTMYEEARDLVGIDAPRQEITGWLKCEERQLKVVAIFGIGGQGKTTLAMEVYRKIEEPYDCRASVTVSRTPDIKKLLRDILFQINRGEFERSELWEMEQLVPTLRQHLMDKRYLIVIDDIWSVLAWEHVKSALPNNNNRSRIIITTRSKAVAKSCCTSIDGHMYEAKPLSEDDSQTLFFRRIFCPREDCPQNLKAIATDILRKCGGLPLAIISIAGLLANRNRTVEFWVKISNSVSSAVEKDSSIEKMKRILFLSYFDLPHYLKGCFLYLSVFPEDYRINCQRLIWLWVAEGLIPGQNRESMEQQGESYLNELINRSMIQPTRIGADGTTVKFCRIHDVILDFIVSQAVEDNFVAIWNGKDKDFSGNYSNKIRRLSVQRVISGSEDIAKATKNVSHLLRSVNIFESDLVLCKHVPGFLNSKVLRVLNISSNEHGNDVGHTESCHFGHIESFTQLKYLRIATYTNFRLLNETGMVQYIERLKLPEEIDKLKHLETLDVAHSSLEHLPASIVQLQKLVRLYVPERLQLPDGIGSLQALEELSDINPCKASTKSIQGLGQLTKLRKLVISWDENDRHQKLDDVEGHKKVCISSLCKLLVSLRTLKVSGYPNFARALMASDSGFTLALTPPPLQRLIFRCSMFPSVPGGISSLLNLTRLKLDLFGDELSKEGLITLASLPMLLSLTVRVPSIRTDYLHPRRVIGRQGFQRLLKFNFECIHGAAIDIEPEAMPKLQRLKFMLEARLQSKYGRGGLVLQGLKNLASLKHISVVVWCSAVTVEEVETLEDDLRGAAGAHPNCPVLEIRRELTECMRN